MSLYCKIYTYFVGWWCVSGVNRVSVYNILTLKQFISCRIGKVYVLFSCGVCKFIFISYDLINDNIYDENCCGFKISDWIWKLSKNFSNYCYVAYFWCESVRFFSHQHIFILKLFTLNFNYRDSIFQSNFHYKNYFYQFK